MDIEVTKPRIFLAAAVVANLVIGYYTATYPANYLWMPDVWAFVAYFAAAVCLLALTDGPKMVLFAGAVLVAESVGRGVVVGLEVFVRGTEGVSRNGFVVGMTVWFLLALAITGMWLRLAVPMWPKAADDGTGRRDG